MVSLLDRKLLRDLRALSGQVASIALLVAAGVAVLVGSLSSWLSLRAAQERTYAEGHFGDVFATLHRAPRTLLREVAAIPGLGAVEGRVVGEVRLDWPRSRLPVAGKLISLPAAGEPGLNRLFLAAGRLPDPAAEQEAVLHAAFAEAWGLAPGATLAVVANGRRAEFRIVGIAHAPDQVFASRPGVPLPDDRGYAVIWAPRGAVARAFDMEGAFNDLSARLAPGGSERAALAALERLLEPNGGAGAVGRAEHPSHQFLQDELAEQRTSAVVVPLIFLGIAAFLLNTVLGRLVEAQRGQVAALKALGFPAWPIALHYGKLAAVICLAGAALGLAAGVWLGQAMLGTYRPFFRFPELPWTMPAWLPAVALLASLFAGLAGVQAALRRTLRLAPAVGMRPPAPRDAQLRLGAGLPPRWKMALRGLVGRPLRSLLVVVGLAFAAPPVVMGVFWWDALDALVALHFESVDRGDAMVTLTHAVEARAVAEVAALPGVLAAEGFRFVPARVTAQHRSRRIMLQGLPEQAALRVPRDLSRNAIPVPPEGVALSRELARKLGVSVGDSLRIAVLEGRRQALDMPVTALVDDVVGLNAYVALPVLNRMMGDGPRVSLIALRVDPAARAALRQRLDARPHVAAVSEKASVLLSFEETVRGLVVVGAVILTGFGVLIAVGVVYNTARVALQERVWELASLRVLGFSRAEVAGLLFAELGLALAVALPLGLWLAQILVRLIVSARENETFRLPPDVGSATLAVAALVVLAAAAASVLAVRRGIARMDLVAVLKARE